MDICLYNLAHLLLIEAPAWRFAVLAVTVVIASIAVIFRAARRM